MFRKKIAIFVLRARQQFPYGSDIFTLDTIDRLVQPFLIIFLSVTGDKWQITKAILVTETILWK